MVIMCPIVISIVNYLPKTFRPALRLCKPRGEEQTLIRVNDGALWYSMRPDVGEFVVAFLVVLLCLVGLVRQPVGGTLHLLFWRGVAFALLIGDRGRFNFGPFRGNSVDLIGHDSH